MIGRVICMGEIKVGSASYCQQNKKRQDQSERKIVAPFQASKQDAEARRESVEQRTRAKDTILKPDQRKPPYQWRGVGY